MTNPLTHLNKGRWYIRKAERVYGPFPNKLIGRYLILGRITLETEVSQDKLNWSEVRHYSAMVPEVVKEAGTPEGDKALMLARIREDERSSLDKSREGNGSEGLEPEERREEEEQLLTLHRQLRDDVYQKYRIEPRRTPVYILLVVLLLFMLVGGYFASRSTTDARLTDCQAIAEPGINWSGCHKQGEALRGKNLHSAILRNAKLQMADLSSSQLQQADLAYADMSNAILVATQLQQANLKGANLQKANLYSANLKGANLSYAELAGANLSEANLQGAVLDHTLWVNGEQCLAGSIGACLLPSSDE